MRVYEIERGTINEACIHSLLSPHKKGCCAKMPNQNERLIYDLIEEVGTLQVCDEAEFDRVIRKTRLYIDKSFKSNLGDLMNTMNSFQRNHSGPYMAIIFAMSQLNIFQYGVQQIE